jgi:hypothetical protein
MCHSDLRKGCFFFMPLVTWDWEKGCICHGDLRNGCSFCTELNRTGYFKPTGGGYMPRCLQKMMPLYNSKTVNLLVHCNREPTGYMSALFKKKFSET